MKRIVPALLLLLGLGLVSAWNVHHADALCSALEDGVAAAGEHWRSDEYAEAAAELEAALARWNAAEGYTHVFIRHAEIDSCSDAFFELYAAVLDENAREADGCAEKLLYHLRSIRTMEHPTLKSIF